MLRVTIELADEILTDFYTGYTTSRSVYDSQFIENEGKEHVYTLSSTQTTPEFAKVESVNTRFDSVTPTSDTKYDYDYIVDGYDTNSSAVIPAGLNYDASNFYYTPASGTAFATDTVFYSVQNAKPNTDMFIVIAGPEY